jgi:hypothetical protein
MRMKKAVRTESEGEGWGWREQKGFSVSSCGMQAAIGLERGTAEREIAFEMGTTQVVVVVVVVWGAGGGVQATFEIVRW